MPKRRIVSVELGTESFYDILDGKTPGEVIKCMTELQEQYAGREIYFDVSSYGYDGGKELYLHERRLETDKEYEKRIAEEKKARAKKKADTQAKKDKEYAEYVRLKEKFKDM